MFSIPARPSGGHFFRPEAEARTDIWRTSPYLFQAFVLYLQKYENLLFAIVISNGMKCREKSHRIKLDFLLTEMTKNDRMNRANFKASLLFLIIFLLFLIFVAMIRSFKTTSLLLALCFLMTSTLNSCKTKSGHNKYREAKVRPSERQMREDKKTLKRSNKNYKKQLKTNRKRLFGRKTAPGT